MDLREVRELLAYWYEHPPVHEVIYNAYFQHDDGNRLAPTGVVRAPSATVQPRKLEDFMGLPGLGPPQRPARKLLRFPIRVPGETYVDCTPKSVKLYG
jgi:hypothetical protein